MTNSGAKKSEEAEMKKRSFFWLAIAILILAANACVELKYEAYVTIVNIGNLPMTAWMDGDKSTIPAYDYQTWVITLENENEILDVKLEAEPQSADDHDEIIITLRGDRDVQTWLTGWDASEGAGKALKKQSSLIKGPLPKELSSFRR
jgi:hypothetical protein